VGAAFFMFYNGGFDIKVDIIQINLWNRRADFVQCRDWATVGEKL